MKRFKGIVLGTIICLVYTTSLIADVTIVDSQTSFDNALNAVAANDTIEWKTGRYMDIYMDIDRNDIVVRAEELGSVIFQGASRTDLEGDNITLEGFQFIGGDIGTDNVINVRGSHNLLTQLNIRAYTCYKYLRVREESQYVTISYSNFENRLNQADQNILSLLVDNNQPGFHKVQYCSFKNFPGGGNDEGVEPIRIGVSTQAQFESRSLVEFCYFTNCDGDGEIISSKATQNVYRFNTFENNSKAELVLRHGNEAVVYGNFFLNGKGGVRVREGQDHYIYNNYFYQIDDRPIFLQNEPSDPLDNINIGFNTIINCAEVRLGGDGGNRPTNVTFANNIFTAPDDALFEDRTGTETWIGNMAFGSLGITTPSSGVTIADPQLEQNSAGFFGLSENSTAINAAASGFPTIPQFAGMDPVDTDILKDLMGQDRPSSISERDLGCNEYPHNTLIQPIATEENTGPSYNSSMITSVSDYVQFEDNLIEVSLSPNPVNHVLNISMNSPSDIQIDLDILNIQGSAVDSFKTTTVRGDIMISRDITTLPSGIYFLRASINDISSGRQKAHSIKFIKL